MNYNDKIQTQEGFVLNTQEDEPYESNFLAQSDGNRQSFNKNKKDSEFQIKALLIKGKQNDCQNTIYNNRKNIVTNHSFNGFFNENTKKMKNNKKQQQSQKIELSDIEQKNYQFSSPANFNSSGKLSNLQFVTDSSKSHSQQCMHPEVRNLMKKYFPSNYQNTNFYAQYIIINDFVQILLEQFQGVIGKQYSFHLIEEFRNKIYFFFGDKIYFQDLFQKTLQKGLIGLIFQVFKSIEQDEQQRKQIKQIKIPIKPSMQIRDSKFQSKNILSSMQTQKSNRIIGFSDVIEASVGNKSNVTKISLDKFFGGSISKAQINQQSTDFFQQNLQQVKQILSDYIEGMYEEAQTKLNKKFTQQLKKISLKYKETQKLLQKINQKVSNHYDSIQLQKQYEKKLKMMSEKENQLQNRIKKLEYENKASKDQLQKEKINSFKSNQQLQKIKEKMEKYQNAIFQKAMNSNNNTSLIKDSSNSINTLYPQQSQNSFYQENPNFQLKIDAVAEHKTSNGIVYRNPPTYSPYVPKHQNYAVTPPRAKQLQRVSVSPIKQRISFIKTQNPSLNIRIPSYNENISETKGVYASSLHNIASNASGNDNLKISNVQRVQIGQQVQLRPLSPIGKLGQIPNTIYQNPYNQRSYSPIKVQFCASRVSTINQINR